MKLLKAFVSIEFMLLFNKTLVTNERQCRLCIRPQRLSGKQGQAVNIELACAKHACLNQAKRDEFSMRGYSQLGHLSGKDLQS